MPLAGATTTQRFVRRTSLQPNEYRTNFRQIDCDVIATLTSPEASKVTSHMSKVYLALVNSPSDYWEREGVLRFAGCEKDDDWQTAWEQLVSQVGVASATARKALAWMSKEGVIGYYAGRNGVGIRIFINRATSSIGQKAHQGQKNLRLVRASKTNPPTSPNDMPFNGSFAVLDSLEQDKDPRAPENGAPETNSDEHPRAQEIPPPPAQPPVTAVPSPPGKSTQFEPRVINSAAIVAQIVREITPQIRAVAAREQERTREWFINHAMPKAIRVGQRSGYDVLRSYGVLNDPRSSGQKRNPTDSREVGKHNLTENIPRPLTDGEITQLAESCVALLVTQGQSIERTISEMMSEAGGFLLREDAPKVRARAEALTHTGAATTQDDGGEGNGC